MPVPDAAGAAGAADAVDVALAVLGRVEVDDVRDAVDVDAAGGDVGGDQDVDVPGLEAGQGLLALALGLVAVHRDGLDALVREALDQPVGAALGADEDERQVALGSAARSTSGRSLCSCSTRQEAVLDAPLGGRRRRDVLVAARRRCV